jgi:large subunit ribosomal protein L9
LKQRAHKEAKMVEAANKTAEALRHVDLKIEAKAGAGAKLFGAVTNQDVAAELAKLGHQIDKKFIQIAGGSIKVSGKNSAKVRLHRDVVVDFHFEVVPVEA